LKKKNGIRQAKLDLVVMEDDSSTYMPVDRASNPNDWRRSHFYFDIALWSDIGRLPVTIVRKNDFYLLVGKNLVPENFLFVQVFDTQGDNF
jgi:hypothetical protein